MISFPEYQEGETTCCKWGCNKPADTYITKEGESESFIFYSCMEHQHIAHRMIQQCNIRGFGHGGCLDFVHDVLPALLISDDHRVGDAQ